MENYAEVFEKLIPGLLNIFHDSISRIILYGSVARGTQTSESDVDIAVIVNGYTKTMHNTMTDFVVDLELEYNKVLSVLLIDYDKPKENTALPWIRIADYFPNIATDFISGSLVSRILFMIIILLHIFLDMRNYLLTAKKNCLYLKINHKLIIQKAVSIFEFHTAFCGKLF